MQVIFYMAPFSTALTTDVCQIQPVIHSSLQGNMDINAVKFKSTSSKSADIYWAELTCH